MEEVSQADPSHLLQYLDSILDSDPFINEVGFIHPSQFLALNEEAAAPVSEELSAANSSDMVFWHRDHKLGISTQYLVPLYKAAKCAFMAAVGRYNDSNLSAESGEKNVSSLQDLCAVQVMKRSRALLLLTSDFGTAWNYRKLMILREPHVSTYMDELGFSKLVLSYSPKSECAWSHRRWVIKKISGNCLNLQEIVENESDLVKLIAEKSKMNYRAWNHRCWLVSYMSSEQVKHEITSSRVWAGLNVADNSCFHYRSEELDWNETLIKRYIGREALWLYRRFLSLFWVDQFAIVDADALAHINQTPISTGEIKTFLDNEVQLFYSCQGYSNNDFEDYQAQATFSATYMLWITRHFSQYAGFELIMKLRLRDLQEVLDKYCPERSFLWDFLRTP
ncbi:uncharacterized protein LOC108224403 isoform X2 [Daucus carota subsp. sativus]|uniref:uncharacterized protein LOC108224403 isoform X2 n=1 Tax=Daucus carota subsp. sativus TaxID=79200 RepID=UPI003082DE41